MSLPKAKKFYNAAFMTYHFLPSTVCEMVLIIVSATNRKLLWLILILACLHLDPEKKKTGNYLTK